MKKGLNDSGLGMFFLKDCLFYLLTMFIANKTIVYDLTGIHEHKNDPNDVCTAFQVWP